MTAKGCTGLFSNQGEKSINFYFIMVPLRKNVLKYGAPKPSVFEDENGNRGFLKLGEGGSFSGFLSRVSIRMGIKFLGA